MEAPPTLTPRWETSWGSLLRSSNVTLKLAAQTAACSEEYIRRHLDFLYNQPSSSVLTAMAQLTNQSPTDLEAMYYLDRSKARALQHWPVHEHLELLGPNQPPVAHRFFRIAVAPTFIMYCRMFCLNPILVERYEARGGPIPPWLNTALIETCPHYGYEGLFK